MDIILSPREEGKFYALLQGCKNAMKHKIKYIIGSFSTYVYIHENPFLRTFFLLFLSPCSKAYTQNCFITTAVYYFVLEVVPFSCINNIITAQRCTLQIRHTSLEKFCTRQIQCNATNIKTQPGRSDLTVSFVGFLRFTYCQCIQGEMTAGA